MMWLSVPHDKGMWVLLRVCRHPLPIDKCCC